MLQELAEFLDTVVTTPSGYIELGIRNGSWQQVWYEWPTQRLELCERALDPSSAGGDVYFSSHLFQTKDSHKDNVLPSRTIQADLDDADVSGLSLVPTILNQTSPGRHQGFWIASEEFDSLEIQERMSRKLTYSIPLCDRSGWSLGHKVRVPFTSNYKYKTGPYPVLLVRRTDRLYSIDELEVLPELPDAKTQAVGPNGQATAGTLDLGLHKRWIENPPQTNSKGAFEILDSVKDQLTATVYAQYVQEEPALDRSLALFALMAQCFRAGLGRDDVYWVAYHSPNNKFKQDLRYNHERELAKDVLRVEAVVHNTQMNLRDVINEIRKKSKMLLNERSRLIFELVKKALRDDGDFVHCVDGRRYYIARDTGRPVEIESYAESLHNILDIKYSLNKTEKEHEYTMHGLVAYAGALPETVQVASLSHYDMKSKQVLVHSGRKDVYLISAGRPEPQKIENGEYGIVFPWDRVVEPFTPVYDPGLDWGAELFDIPNCSNMTTEEARVILKVWLIFSLLREAATSRPLLAFLGQPGSGKTSTARKLYAFFYGRHMDVSGATTPVNYDMATASMPFFVLDNLDTWEKWVPDRLAQSAGKSDIIVRKLYTNNQIVRIKRQAMVCVTAHDPKFGRADVTDRMLIISLTRFSIAGIPFADEGAMLNRVLTLRNKLWGSVLHDLQQIMNTPMPETTSLQLRIQDYARLGEWIAIGMGQQEVFRSAIYSIQAAQQSFNLDENHVLVTAVQRWLLKRTNTEPRSQDQLYGEVMSLVPSEEIKPFMMMYKSSSAFVKRISNLQDTLNNTMFKVELEVDKDGARVWRVDQI